TDAGVNTYAAGELTAGATRRGICGIRTRSRSEKRRVHHASWKIEPIMAEGAAIPKDAGIQVTVKTPGTQRWDIFGSAYAFVNCHGLSAVRSSRDIAIAGAGQCGLEKRLSSYGPGITNATSSAHVLDATTVLQDHIGVCLIKSLTTLGHHVRHRVDIDGLILVVNQPTDITCLEGD